MVFRIEVAGVSDHAKAEFCNEFERRGAYVIRGNSIAFKSRNKDVPLSMRFNKQMLSLITKASLIESADLSHEVIVSDFSLFEEHIYNDLRMGLTSEFKDRSHPAYAAWRVCQDVIKLKRQSLGDPDMFVLLEPSVLTQDEVDLNRRILHGFMNTTNDEILRVKLLVSAGSTGGVQAFEQFFEQLSCIKAPPSQGYQSVAPHMK